MGILLVVFLFIIMLFMTLFVASYMTHIEMSTGQHKPYDYVTFERFMKEFNKYKDDPRLEYNKSFKSIFLKYWNDKHTYHYDVYLHASIVMFDDKCMIFYPVDWFKYCIWMKKQFRPNRSRGMWNNDWIATFEVN